VKIFRIAKEVKKEYSWVYINLPKDIQKMLLSFGEEIDVDDLYTKEADGGLEKDCHITVKYGLLTNDVKDIKGRLSEEKGGSVYLGKSSIFEGVAYDGGDGYDVVKVTVESKDLSRIHSRLNELQHNDKYPDYCAHATIAYVKRGTGKKYDGKFKVNKSCDFDCVYFGDIDKKDHKVKLK
jgi:hypothetical protein